MRAARALGCVKSAHENDESGSQKDGSQSSISHNNVLKSSQHSVTLPSLMPHDKIHINQNWVIAAAKHSVEDGVTPFNMIIEKHPHIYTKYFEKESAKSKEPITNAVMLKNDVFVHHQRSCYKALRHIIIKMMTDHLDDTLETLKRLGSLHAENNVTFSDLYLYEDGLMAFIGNNNPSLNPIAKEACLKLVRYILRAIAMGMTLHHDKLLYCMAPQSSNKRTCKRCFTLQAKTPTPTIQEEAMKSMDNFVKFVQEND